MNILFVYRGFGKKNNNSIVDAQIESLASFPINIIKFPISGGGLRSYLSALFRVFRVIRLNEINLIHAHYSYSGFIAGIAFPKRTICSLMGSDVYRQNRFILFLTKLYSKHIWKYTITKSADMQKHFPVSITIPNGVDFSKFYPIHKDKANEIAKFDLTKKNVIFIAHDTSSSVKNFGLAEKSIEKITGFNIVLHKISNVPPEKMVNYYNAAELLVLSSINEGSPNVVKEALACNCPIVSTDVGDVRSLTSGVEGCFITELIVEAFSDSIRKALLFNNRTNGREKISWLESGEIAKKLMNLYKNAY